MRAYGEDSKLGEFTLARFIELINNYERQKLLTHDVMKLCKLIAVLALLSSASVTVHASGLGDFLITIDESDPSHVIFSATSASPSASDSTHYFGDGLDFTQFLTSAVGSTAVMVNGSSLTTGYDGTPTFDAGGIDDLSGSNVDFNLYNLEDYESASTSESPANGTIIENFSTDTTAFTGLLTADFSAYLSELPGLGATGDIYAGYNGDTAGPIYGATPVLIGQWQVIAGVPEPGQWGCLIFLGAAVLFGARRLRCA